VSEPIKRSALRKVENAEAFPLIALQALRELRSDLEHRENDAIRRARELGASLEDIADAMGITRQGVAYRLKTMNGDGDESEGAVVEIPDDSVESGVEP
jgi:predicted transcriptional regulator